jgi:hypothetical protein
MRAMKKSKFTEEQSAYALRQIESGSPPADGWRRLGAVHSLPLRPERDPSGAMSALT